MEMCVVMGVISILSLCALPVHMVHMQDKYLWPADYLVSQTKAMKVSRNVVYKNAYATVYFNAKGNVRSAQTIQIDNRVVVSELGEGKLVFK